MELGDFDAAIADFTEAIRLSPEFAQAYFGRGTAYADKAIQDYDRAIADFSEAIRLNPESAETYNERGLRIAKGLFSPLPGRDLQQVRSRAHRAVVSLDS